MDDQGQRSSGLPHPAATSKLPLLSRHPLPRSYIARPIPARETLAAATDVGGSHSKPRKLRPVSSRGSTGASGPPTRPRSHSFEQRTDPSPQNRDNPPVCAGSIPEEFERDSTPAQRHTSLNDRTIETLSLLPSSPAVRGKAAASFYGQSGARPNSSQHESEVTSRGPSESKSKPSSNSEPEEKQESNIQATINSTYASKTVAARALSCRPSLNGLIGLNSLSKKPSMHSLERQPSIATLNTNSGLPSLDRMPSVHTLNEKVSVPVLDRSATAARKTSSKRTHASNAPIVSARNALTVDPAQTQARASKDTDLISLKSSAALRAQIANARAAKRIAARSARKGAAAAQSPLVPTDMSFDFGLSNDVLDHQRDGQSQTKILKARLETARTSGRLDIAALGLKEIPVDVMNMYSLDSMGGSGGAWAESVDLTRFVAANNELETVADFVFPDRDIQDFADDEHSQSNIFGDLVMLDLHGNMLIALPLGLGRLSFLTCLNLSRNQLANDCLKVLSQISSLRDLKLGDNLLHGPLDPCFASLVNLEVLDLHKNHIASLPSTFGHLRRLRILNLAENEIERLPFEILATLPLIDIVVRKNQLSGILIQDMVESLPKLQSLDVSANRLTHVVAPARQKPLRLPALQQLYLSINRLVALPEMSTWKELVTLSGDENCVSAFPKGFATLDKLRTVDFSCNDIRVIPAEVGRMEKLAMLRLSGNPLRDKNLGHMETEDLKSVLLDRMEPPPKPSQPGMSVLTRADCVIQAFGEVLSLSPATPSDVFSPLDGHADDGRSEDHFATPTTSAPTSPMLDGRPRASCQLWVVKPGGVLDRSNTQSSSLHAVICSELAASNTIRNLQLHHNLFTNLPDSLLFFTETLTVLSLAHNQLVGESYFGHLNGAQEALKLPALQQLSLASNQITGLASLTTLLHAPNLQKLDVAFNRISALPPGTELRDAFPALTSLHMSNNHIGHLHVESIVGMRIVDAANNDITHLNPRIGLLAVGCNGQYGAGTLERLDVGGNQFRVPRWNVLERGTEATLRWLRGRVSIAEMGEASLFR